MTLFDLLTTMQDTRVDLHLYKNYTQGEDKTREEIENIEGTNNEVFIRLCNKHYRTSLTNVFYIGYSSTRSKTLRVNAEVVEE